MRRGKFRALAYLLMFLSIPGFGAAQTTDPELSAVQELLRTGQLSEAERAARQYISNHQTSADGYYLLGSVLFLEKKARESLAAFTDGAKYRTPNAENLKVVASDYVVLGDYEDADKWFTKVLQWTPGDVQAWYYLGRTKYNENRFEEAIDAFHHCLQLDARNVKAEDNLGLSYEGLGRNDEAAAAYRTAIEWQKDAPVKDPGPYLDLGTLLVQTSKPSEGLPHLLEAATLSPDNPKVHNQLGKAYMHMNQLAKAQAELEKAVALKPDSAPEHFMLGQIYHKEGMEDKARAEMARFKALNGAHSTDMGGMR